MHNLENLAESTLTNYPDELEVFKPRILPILLLKHDLRGQVRNTGLHLSLFFIRVIFFGIALVILGELILFISQCFSIIEIETLRLFVRICRDIQIFSKEVSAPVSELCGRIPFYSTGFVLFGRGKSLKV